MASTESQKPVSVLFVCLGNICRSPMAEGVFTHLASTPRRHPLISRIDSAGTGAYHVGDAPDSRTMSVLEDNGITSYMHRARKVRQSDFTEFDYIMAMDEDNFDHLVRTRHVLEKKGVVPAETEKGAKGVVRLWGDFGGKRGEEVIDPYYGGRDGFEIAYEQMVRFTNGFLKWLEKGADLGSL